MPTVNFDFFDSPVPTERGFFIEVEESPKNCPLPDYDAGFVYFTTRPSTLGASVSATACPDWITRGSKLDAPYASYRLIYHEKASGRMMRRFYFLAHRTDEQRATPVKKEKWELRQWPWPTVLLKLWAERGLLPSTVLGPDGNPVSTDTIHPRTRYRRGDTFPTWVKITEYLSDEPFPRSSRMRTPITDGIHWSIDGFSGSFPPCFHPGVKVPTINSPSKAVLFGFGTPEKGIGADLYGMEYPQTPMTDWEPYMIEDLRADIIPGGIAQKATRYEVYPPIDDRENQT